MAAVFGGLLLLLVIFLFGSSSKSSTSGRTTRPKQYGFQATTLENVNVKSYSEKRLADYFTQNNIKYVYEPGLRHLYADPDFYLPEHDVYVEFWGLLNATDAWAANRYEKSMRRKMAIYHKNNIKFISIYPKNLKNLDWIFRKKFENVTGKKLPVKRYAQSTRVLTCLNCGLNYDISDYSTCPNCGSEKRGTLRV